MKALNPIDGSWWLDWVNWLQERCGKPVSPPSKEALRDYPSLGKAPGKYVLE
jgi:polyhydroxyalkanoate synthase